MSIEPCVTFQSFVRVPAARCAYRLCRSFARSATGGPRVLLLHGPTGIGKSHLLRAVGSAFRSHRPDARVLVTIAADLAHELNQAIRIDRVRDFESSYRNLDLLIVDDFQALARKPATQVALAASLASCVANGTFLIGAATVPPHALAPFRGRIGSRVRQCSVQPPTRREIRMILEALAAKRGVTISRSMTTQLARHSRGDVRRAVGAVIQLEAASAFSVGDMRVPWMEEFSTQAGW